ncbi:tail fiber domain-containing protein [Cellulosimicrobium cellulans]|uniref:tail fiber domain-containing protein n=1 Tax=Cellulosimicrobium cellulans TaxID=1710 RepID=UPI003653A460
MANGDAAAAAGMDVVPGAADIRQGYDEVNKTRDYLAVHAKDGTHPWSKITNRPATFPPSSHTHSAISGDGASVNVGSDGDPRVWSQAVYNRTYGTNVVDDGANRLAVVTNQGTIGTLTGKIDASLIANLPNPPAPSSVANTVSQAAYDRSVSGGGYFAMWMDSGLRIGRNTSSRRYKEQIEPHDVDPAAVLALRPVSYHRKGSPADEYEFGLIAEEVDDAGLPELVTTFGGEIDGVRYDLLGVALLAVVQDQAAQLVELRARLDALTVPTTPEEPTDGAGQ